jgi:ABC-type nickel/cobalt efflux system permease component RcnA
LYFKNYDLEVLVIIVLIFFISAYLLKRFWPLIIRWILKRMQQKMQKRYQEQQHQHKQQSNSRHQKNNSNNNSTDHLGEYVDYEEID